MRRKEVALVVDCYGHCKVLFEAGFDVGLGPDIGFGEALVPGWAFVVGNFVVEVGCKHAVAVVHCNIVAVAGSIVVGFVDCIEGVVGSCFDC